jgi:hypothetical protein
VFGKALNALVNGVNALPITAGLFNPDIVRPVLSSFNLSMNSRALTLSFSETVRASLLQITYITLQSKADTSGDSYQLTVSSTSVSNNGPVLVVPQRTFSRGALSG